MPRGPEGSSKRAGTYLGLFPATHYIALPPHMARRQHRRRLMALFQQLAPMQRRLCNQRIVIIVSKHPTRLQARNDADDSLQLRARLRDALFVNHKRLNKEFVRELFQLALVRDGRGEQKEAQADVGNLAFVVERGSELVDQFEKG